MELLHPQNPEYGKGWGEGLFHDWMLPSYIVPVLSMIPGTCENSILQSIRERLLPDCIKVLVGVGDEKRGLIFLDPFRETQNNSQNIKPDGF